jgi:hypothetical protein
MQAYEASRIYAELETQKNLFMYPPSICPWMGEGKEWKVEEFK